LIYSPLPAILWLTPKAKEKIMRRISALIIALVFILQASAKPAIVSGIAVSAQMADSTGGLEGTRKIFKYTITNGATTNSTMLFKGLVGRPVISPDGQKIAFLTIDNFWNPTKECILVMNVNGGVADTVAKDLFPSNLITMPFLDWPSGDCVYYDKGWMFSDSSKKIFKVNVLTKEKVLVVAMAGGDSNRLWLGSFSNDGSKAILRVYDYLHLGSGGLASIFRFNMPALGSTISVNDGTYPIVGTDWGCGSAISPSGNYVMSMGTLNHDAITFKNFASGSAATTIPLSTMATWGHFFGLGTGGDNRWSANSDKWICLSVGWTGRDGNGGSNQVLINWQDSQMVQVTSSLSGQTSMQYNEPGDFWVAGTTDVKQMPVINKNSTLSSHGSYNLLTRQENSRNCARGNANVWDVRGRACTVGSRIPAVYITEKK
jgi:hypothetical protein